MLDNKTINELIGVTESFHASYKLFEILEDKETRENLFNKFLQHETDLSYDWFTDYFQEEHSDRKGKKQDFTPDCVVTLLSGLLGETKSNVDICSGTGGLTIKRYASNQQAKYYCEEFSDRAMPFLLFNLTIRNVDAYVLHGDSLTREFKTVYKLTKSETFSNISKVDDAPEWNAQTVIMNPPYSLAWNPLDSYKYQERFIGYGIAPKTKADFAFLLQGFHMLDENGKMAIILPHGVLFRGNAEGEIRKKLLDNNMIDAVIGLPGKLFYNTDIPTVILILKKNKKTDDVLFVDASEEYNKDKSHNSLSSLHIAKILKTVNERRELKRYSHIATYDELKENDFNLNIPRYVDTYIPPVYDSLEKITSDLRSIDAEIIKTERELAEMMKDLVGNTPTMDKSIKAFADYFSKRVDAKELRVEAIETVITEVIEVEEPKQERKRVAKEHEKQLSLFDD